MKVPAENASRYLKSRLGVVNEAIKKAYICGKRIFVLVTDDAELVRNVISRESVIQVRRAIKETFNKTTTYKGENSVEYVDGNPHFIKADVESVGCRIPTLFLSTDGRIPAESLINYGRHYNGLSSFRSIDSTVKANLDNLRKSIIVIVTAQPPSFSSAGATDNREVAIPKQCSALTEIITVPYLGRKEFEEIVSLWLKEHEGIEVENVAGGYVSIADKAFLQRIYQVMRAMQPTQIIQCLERCRLDFGRVYYADESDPGFGTVLKAIRKESDSIISKSGALSLVDASKAQKPDGLHEIVSWIDNNKDRVADPTKYETFLMSPPKGILISGVPGSGKSLLAKYIASTLRLSLVRLDLGDALGRYVGDSEKGFKTALEIAEALSPCVLWIDEMEKMFEGENEVTRRLIGKFLTWMQEKTERGVSCFVYATANDIGNMPPEMFRSGRFDEKFYTFMPGAEDCADIFESIIRFQNSAFLNRNKEDGNDRTLFNTSRVNRKAFLNILDSDICVRKTSEAGKDNGLDTDRKMFIGSDIEKLISSAKLIYLRKSETEGLDAREEKFAIKPEAENAVFDSERFLECVKEAIGEMRTYGETNLEKVAFAFAAIAKNNFIRASKRDIVPLRGYNEANFRQAFTRNRHTDEKLYALPDEGAHLSTLKHSYDRQLYYAVRDMINTVSLEIIEQRR